METDNFIGHWKEESKRISENVKINKEASFHKLRTSFQKVRIRRLLHLIQMCITVPLVFAIIVFPLMKNDGTDLFYLALVSFIGPVLFTFIYYIYYYICLLKIDFSESILKAQKKIYRLEMLDKKLNLSGLIFVPIVTLSTFKIFSIPFKLEAIIMLALVVVILISSFLIRSKILIPNEYCKMKSYFDEANRDSGS